MQPAPTATVAVTVGPSASVKEWNKGEKVVDGIFRLAGPQASAEATCDIVLFHGLSLDGRKTPESYYRTWRAEGAVSTAL